MLTNTIIEWGLGLSAIVTLWFLYRKLGNRSVSKKLSRYLDYPNAVVILKNGKFFMSNQMARKLYIQNKLAAHVKGQKKFFYWLDQQEAWVKDENQYLLQLGDSYLKRKVIETNLDEIQVCYYLAYTIPKSFEYSPAEIPPLQIQKKQYQPEIITSFSLKPVFTTLLKDCFNSAENEVLVMGVSQDVVIEERPESFKHFMQSYFNLLNESANPWLKIFEINAKYQVHNNTIIFDLSFSYRAKGEVEELFDDRAYRKLLALIHNGSRHAVPCFEINYPESSNIICVTSTLEMKLNIVPQPSFLSNQNLNLK